MESVEEIYLYIEEVEIIVWNSIAGDENKYGRSKEWKKIER
jgi:hypothetical protein